MTTLTETPGEAAPVALTPPASPRRGAFARHTWWLVRVAMFPVHLLVFTILTFLLIRTVPGDPVQARLGPTWTQDDYDRMAAAMGLDGSLWDQLVTYLDGLVHGDLGVSLATGKPVADDLLARLPPTLELAAIALTTAVLLSLLASYVAVFHPRLPVGRVVRAYGRIAGAIPEIVIALIGLFVFYATLGWAPAPLGRLSAGLSQPLVTGFPFLDTLLTGQLDATVSMAAHLVLPVGTLVVAQSAILVKIMIAGLEQAIAEPATLFRIASNGGRAMAVVSAYRRALPTVVTLCGSLLGYLIGGAVVLETLFGFAGMGEYAVTAVRGNDYVALQGFLLTVAAVALVVFLVVDLVNMWLDPRRRPGATTEV